MPPSWMVAWANAIAQFEGFDVPGSRPQRNHNPGDLKYAGQPGATGHDAGGFAIFPDVATGFQALYNQLQKYVNDFPQYSILQIMAHYLGQSVPTTDSQGDAFSYAQTVANGIGVSTSTTLAELAAGVTSPPAQTPEAPTSADSSPPSDSGGWTPSSGELAAIAIAGGALLLVAMRFGR